MTKKSTSSQKNKAKASKPDPLEEPLADDEAAADDAGSREAATVAPASDAKPPPDRASDAEKQPRRSAGIVVWIAVILSLAALTGSAYQLFVSWRAGNAASENDAALADISGSLSAANESLDALRRRLDELASRDVASVTELQAVERRFNETLQGLESLPGRVANLEGSMSSLQGISAGVRDTWLVAEAEYYMQIANAQLQLAGNPDLASLALHFADERLKQLADPALTEVRRALADELQAIDMMQKPDIEGVTLTLASLAGVVDSLPLREEVDVADQEMPEIEPGLSGIDRALASLKRAIGDVISVRRTDEAAKPLVAPDAVYFLRTNLGLQLQAARLALLRNEQEIFEQSLDDAAVWLDRYYDTDSAPVQGALETIAEIRNGMVTASPPDISGSLKLLRQHKALSGSAKPPAAGSE